MSDENININQEPEEKEGETKAEKFQRIAAYRVNKAIDAISAIEKLSNTSSYEYSEEMVEKMFGAMESRLNEVRNSFKKKEEKKSSFSF